MSHPKDPWNQNSPKAKQGGRRLSSVQARKRLSGLCFLQDPQRCFSGTHLSLAEEVGQVLHSIAANAGNILELPRVRSSECLDSVTNIIGDFHTELQAQHECIWEQGGQGHYKRKQQSAILCPFPYSNLHEALDRLSEVSNVLPPPGYFFPSFNFKSRELTCGKAPTSRLSFKLGWQKAPWDKDGKQPSHFACWWRGV